MAADGPHAGDMPNLHIPAGGELAVELLNTNATLEKGKPNSVFDADGSAVVVSASSTTQDRSNRNAGGRIACGVIE